MYSAKSWESYGPVEPQYETHRHSRGNLHLTCGATPARVLYVNRRALITLHYTFDHRFQHLHADEIVEYAVPVSPVETILLARQFEVDCYAE